MMKNKDYEYDPDNPRVGSSGSMRRGDYDDDDDYYYDDDDDKRNGRRRRGGKDVSNRQLFIACLLTAIGTVGCVFCVLGCFVCMRKKKMAKTARARQQASNSDNIGYEDVQ
mmetsp:Transcript_66246/g.91709  ORF Transcript_66246/g.91709 Transcript_66246/m.91709 type:complete len:111 (-) Transcript_66246:59-391(-)